MRCQRAFEADLPAVLRGEGGDVEFLAHYPTCADCAAELRVWGELDAMLRAGAPAAGTHPTPAALLAFVDAPATLAAATREGIERHVAGCRSCADEIGSLRRFDPDRLAAVAAAPPAAGAPVSTAPSEESPPRGSWLPRLVWHPAFAYALVVALLVPVLRDQLRRFSVPGRASDARREVRVPIPAVDIGAPAPAAAPPVVALAQKPSVDGGQRADVPAGVGSVGKAAPVPPPRFQVEAPARQAPAESVPRAESAAEDSSEKDASAGRLADHMGGASRRSAAPAGTSAAPVVVNVRADSHTVIPLAVAEGGPLLRIVPPAGVGDGAVDVQVRARVGARELVERRTSHANAIELAIPPHWLTAGDYTITLAPVTEPAERANGAARRAPAAVTLGFSVHASSTMSADR